MSDQIPSSPSGEPASSPGSPTPYTEAELEQLAETAWTPSSRLARLVSGGVTFTLKVTPYAITFWLFAPDELRYEIRKLSRWLPWGVRYALWWLKQEGL